MFIRLVAATLVATAALPALALTPLERERIERLTLAADRPVATYVRLDPSEFGDAAQSTPQMLFAPGGPALPVYMNRFGGRYTCGDNDSLRNVSSIACGASPADVGGFPGSDAEWDAVVDCVTDLFAPFNLYVTDLEPTEGRYVESVVGGRPGEIGMPNGVGGVAPYDCTVIDNAIVYTFADVYYGGPRFVQDVCETVAQEVAHAFTLDHQFMCEDPMTYLTGCGPKTFQDTYAVCGEYEPRECACGGESQNSVQAMFELVGTASGEPPPPQPVDVAVPEVALLSPATDTILPANTTMEVVATASDDVGLTFVELQWDFTGETMYCPSEGGAYTCTRNGTSYVWRIDVGVGSRSFRVHVRDVAGNEVTTDTVSVWLSPDGLGPPVDTGPPQVRIGSPLDQTIIPLETPVAIVASIVDDNALARAELFYRGALLPCPFEGGGGGGFGNFSCSISGDTYTWIVESRRETDRQFAVIATDIMGNVTETPLRTIKFRDGAVVVVDDNRAGDDTFDTAQSVACGETLELVATNDDWFIVQAQAGQTVSVVVDGQAQNAVDLVATSGPRDSDVLATGDASVEFVAPTDAPRVGLLPTSIDAGTYTIEIVCTDPAVADDNDTGGDAPGFFDCSTGAPSSFGVLGLALLALRRRRR